MLLKNIHYRHYRLAYFFVRFDEPLTPTSASSEIEITSERRAR